MDRNTDITGPCSIPPLLGRLYTFAGRKLSKAAQAVLLQARNVYAQGEAICMPMALTRESRHPPARVARVHTEYDSIQCHLVRWWAVDSIMALSIWSLSPAVEQLTLQKREKWRHDTGNESRVLI